jgi:hypothetical protein
MKNPRAQEKPEAYEKLEARAQRMIEPDNHCHLAGVQRHDSAFDRPATQPDRSSS